MSRGREFPPLWKRWMYKTDAIIWWNISPESQLATFYPLLDFSRLQTKESSDFTCFRDFIIFMVFFRWCKCEGQNFGSALGLREVINAGVMAISSLWFFFLDFFVCLSEIAIRPDMGIFLLITIKPKVHSRHFFINIF